ncbi:hypothetical protein NADFUDRAFT_82307 [Nadsonia fulvescens var. elongata DSM 6958]|uniref:Uncharacterized protein n=1 Tax=Nadsonia fulvescens var. elongata DSM 6958 TaxID=857566 RepID=A0A1E3PNJ7_9ASCO|nr:hypothetical protein NADFUDRAFT_82307 [Nadsonia fulvescens var. elongata DSM 6958]
MSFKHPISSLFIGSSTFPSFSEESESDEQDHNKPVDDQREDLDHEFWEANEVLQNNSKEELEQKKQIKEFEVKESEESEEEPTRRKKLEDFGDGDEDEDEGEDEGEDEDEDEGEDEDFEEFEEEYDEEEFNESEYPEEKEDELHEEDFQSLVNKNEDLKQNDDILSKQTSGSKENQVYQYFPKEAKPFTKSFLKQKKDARKIKKYHNHLATEDISVRREHAMKKLRSTWDAILQKYGVMSAEEQGDILDLNTCEVIEDNGHVESLHVKKNGIWESKSAGYESITSHDEFDIITISSDSDSDGNLTENDEKIKEDFDTPKSDSKRLYSGIRKSTVTQGNEEYTDTEDPLNNGTNTDESDLDGIISSSSQRQLSVWSPSKSLPETSPLRTLLRSPNEDLFSDIDKSATNPSIVLEKISAPTPKGSIFNKLIALKHIKVESDLNNNDERLSEIKANSFSKVSRLPLPLKRGASFFTDHTTETNPVKYKHPGSNHAKSSFDEASIAGGFRRKKANISKFTSQFSWESINGKDIRRNRYISDDEQIIPDSDDTYSEIGSDMGMI